MVDIIPQTFLGVWIIAPMLTQSPILFSAMSERLKCIAEEWIAHSPRNAIAAVAARPQLIADYLASLKGLRGMAGRTDCGLCLKVSFKILL